MLALTPLSRQQLKKLVLELGDDTILATDATSLQNQLKAKLTPAEAKQLIEILLTRRSTEAQGGAVLLEKLEAPMSPAAKQQLLQLFTFAVSNEETVKQFLLEQGKYLYYKNFTVGLV